MLPPHPDYRTGSEERRQEIKEKSTRQQQLGYPAKEDNAL
jgi:hypothetical protein